MLVYQSDLAREQSFMNRDLAEKLRYYRELARKFTKGQGPPVCCIGGRYYDLGLERDVEDRWRFGSTQPEGDEIQALRRTALQELKWRIPRLEQELAVGRYFARRLRSIKNADRLFNAFQELHGR